MFLALLDERVVRALQIRLLLHEFEDPPLVGQRRGFGFVRHLFERAVRTLCVMQVWPATVVELYERI